MDHLELVSNIEIRTPLLLDPPLKWAGGKRWLVPFLKPIWAKYSHQRLVEPFCGGLAVSLGLQPKKAILNDINPHLINFYAWLQRGIEINLRMKNEDAYYYNQRNRFNSLVTNGGTHTQEAAQLFYFLNRTGYNGLCRFNRKGEYNVPFGSYKTINYSFDFSNYAKILKNWEFSCKDFKDIELQANDFIYADPPYDVDFRQYSSDGFEWEQQVKLAEWLSGHPGPVVLSNQATKRIVSLYKSYGFFLEYLSAPRRISANGDRTPAREVIAYRNL